MLFQTHSCSNIYFQVVVKCFWVKSWFGLIAMFSEVIPFGVKWLIRGRRVLKQVLKILHASGEWHLKRDPDELPFCAGAQRSALFHQWDLASSRLKLVLCPRKKLKAVDANGHWECAEIWCQCSRRGVMLSALVQLWRLLLCFLGHRKNRTSGLREYGSPSQGSKISHYFGWRQSIWSPLKISHYVRTCW